MNVRAVIEIRDSAAAVAALPRILQTVTLGDRRPIGFVYGFAPPTAAY